LDTKDTGTSTETVTTETTETATPPKTWDDFKVSLRAEAAKATAAKEAGNADPKEDATATGSASDTQASTDAKPADNATSAPVATATGSPDETRKAADALEEIGRLDRQKKQSWAKRQKELDEKAAELEKRAKEFEGLDPVRAAREKVAQAASKVKAATTPEERATALKERATALLELVGGDLTMDDVAELTQAMGAEKPALTMEQVEARVREQIKAEAEAAAKKAADDKKAADEALVKSESNFIRKNAIPFLEENIEKYPALKIDKASEGEVAKLLREGYAANERAGLRDADGKVQLPSWDDIFAFLNQQRIDVAKERALALGLISDKPAAEVKPPVKTITPADKRGAPVVTDENTSGKPKKTSWQEDRAALREAVKRKTEARG
jgi:hypothetical protein